MGRAPGAVDADGVQQLDAQGFTVGRQAERARPPRGPGRRDVSGHAHVDHRPRLPGRQPRRVQRPGSPAAAQPTCWPAPPRPARAAHPRSARRPDRDGARGDATHRARATPAHPSSHRRAAVPARRRRAVPRAVSHAAVHAHATQCSHVVGAGSPTSGGAANTPLASTPARVAYTSDPAPRGVTPSRAARSRGDQPPGVREGPETDRVHPIPAPHASSGAGPTDASHANPASDAGPGPAARLAATTPHPQPISRPQLTTSPAPPSLSPLSHRHLCR